MTVGRNDSHRVVVVGGGFGGLYATQALKRSNMRVTLIDKRNFHLFQPLLYQVATGGLSPGDISSPLRAILKRQKNVRVLLGEVIDLDPDRRCVIMRDGEVEYDTLIVATGARHAYFGNDEWEPLAPGLKTVEDATEIRRRILSAFETAERESDPSLRRTLCTFVIVGAGPTGVELAGALAELAFHTLRHDFHDFSPNETAIILIEGTGRILGSFHPSLSSKAQWSLERLGVTVRTDTMVTGIYPNEIRVRGPAGEETIPSETVLWAAGVQSSPLGGVLTERTGVQLDRIGRVIVEPDLSVSGYPEILVIGDMARVSGAGGEPLPSVAPVAMQQGAYVAKTIRRRLSGKPSVPFRYFDRGSMAVIGRAAAVADFRGFRTGGYAAWLVWLFVHLMYLVEFSNRVLVFIQWAWNYFTRNRGARLITGDDRISRVNRSDAKNE